MVVIVLWNYIFEFLISWLKNHYVCFTPLKRAKFAILKHILNFWAKNSKNQKCNFRELLGLFCTVTWPSFRLLGHLIHHFYAKMWNTSYRDLKSQDPFSAKLGPFLLNISQNGLRNRFFVVLHDANHRDTWKTIKNEV